MNYRRFVSSVVLGCFALAPVLVPSVASASFPVGVWGVVEKVTFEPDAMNPMRVRLDGVFIVANEVPDFPAYPGYSVPEYGYMYYECAKDQIKTCQMEWNDLAAAAMSANKCRGWGDQQLPVPKNGVVRPTDEPQVKADLYPISMGVVQGFSPCEALATWMAENPPPMEGGSSGGETGGSSGGEASSGGQTGGTEGGSTSTTGGGETGGAMTGGGSTGGSASGGSGGGELTSGGGGGSSGGGSTGGSASGGSTGSAGGSGGEPESSGCACDGAGSSGGQGFGALAAVFGALALRRRRR